jgi:hypothetical protein
MNFEQLEKLLIMTCGKDIMTHARNLSRSVKGIPLKITSKLGNLKEESTNDSALCEI